MKYPKLSALVDDVIRTLATLCIGCGLIAFVVAIPRDREREFSTNRDNDGYGLSPRFKSDNAVGATANAVEWIAKRTSEPATGKALWFGLALWGLGSLRRIRVAIERVADKVSPLPAEKPTKIKSEGAAVDWPLG